MKPKKVVVEQDPEQPVETKVLAKAIVNISTAATTLTKSGLNKRAVVTLVADRVGMGKGTVEAVLDCLEDLKRTYTTL